MKTSICILLFLCLAAACRTCGDTICNWTRSETTNEQRYHDVLTLDGGVICLQETITNSDGSSTLTYKLQLSQVDSITDPNGRNDVTILATGNVVSVQIGSDITLSPDHDILLVFDTRKRAIQIVAKLRQLVAGH